MPNRKKLYLRTQKNFEGTDTAEPSHLEIVRGKFRKIKKRLTPKFIRQNCPIQASLIGQNAK